MISSAGSGVFQVILSSVIQISRKPVWNYRVIKDIGIDLSEGMVKVAVSKGICVFLWRVKR